MADSDFAGRPWAGVDPNAPLPAPPVLDADGNPVVPAPAVQVTAEATWEHVEQILNDIELGRAAKDHTKVLAAYAALGKLTSE